MLILRRMNPSIFSSPNSSTVYSSIWTTPALGQYWWHTSWKKWSKQTCWRINGFESMASWKKEFATHVRTPRKSFLWCTTPSAYLSCFHQITECNNHSTPPVMNHLQEVPGCGLHGTLCYDESSPLLVALKYTFSPLSHIFNIISALQHSYIHSNSMNVILRVAKQQYSPIIT